MKKNRIFKILTFVLKEILKYKPSFLILIFFSSLIGPLSAFITILFPKLIIDELLGNQDVNLLIIYILGYGFSNYIINQLKETFEHITRYQNHVISNHFYMIICKKATRMDYEHTEDPLVLDIFEKGYNAVEGNMGGIRTIVYNAINLFSCLFTCIGVISIIAYYSPTLFVFIIILAVISSLINYRMQKIDRANYENNARNNRIFGYIMFTLPDFRYGKDFRLYNAYEMLEEKAKENLKSTRDIWGIYALRKIKWSVLSDFLMAIRYFISYLFLGLFVLGRKLVISFITINVSLITISIGTFTMLLTSINKLYQKLTELLDSITGIYAAAYYLSHLLDFLKYQDSLEKKHLSINKNITPIIEFKNVSFKYPRRDEYILKNINLKFKYGDHISFVGLNGSGKTTLIKLLTRLYDVTEGEILLNNINIKEYEYSEYHQLFAPLFQDFHLFAFSIKENFCLEKNISDEEIYKALEKAGAKEYVEKLEKKLDSNIFNYYDKDGIHPSGGEQQKLAITRTLLKDSSFVILDEPTSALDPLAEYEIYQTFDKLIENKGAIFISHRLSSCRFAQIIYVLDKGRLVEQGNHDQLMANNSGLYCNIFTAQAKYYK